MFNATFFPTPLSLADKMARKVYTSKVKTVLEPSAGKADLLRPLAYRLHANNGIYDREKRETFEGLDIDTIEPQPELRAILETHGLRVVHDDFLTFHTFKQYDLIIMNPPFSEGCKHLQKALDLLEPAGGQLVALLNAETLRNPCTNERRALAQRLQLKGAKVEYIEGAFRDAERKTTVDVAMIYCQVEGGPPKSIIFDGLKRAQELREQQQAAPQALAVNDVERAMAQQYQIEAAAGCTFLDEYKALRPLMQNSFRGKTPLLKVTFDGYNAAEATKNEYLQKLRRKYWHELLYHDNVMALFTSNIRSDYANKVHELGDYDFTYGNIAALKIKMLGELVLYVEDAIVNLFDYFSSYSMDTGANIHYFNGWKTNSAYTVRSKVIVPIGGYEELWGRFNITASHIERTLVDMVKVFNYLDGNRTPDVDTAKRLKMAEAHGVTKNIRFKYFTITFYKKGTAHIEFHDADLLKKFNIFGASKRGWLPPSYGQKRYSDMTQEEKTVVDSFEGAASYSETIQKSAFYLFDASKVLALPESAA